MPVNRWGQYLVLCPLLLVTSGCKTIGDQAFYYPNQTIYHTPKEDGLAYEEVNFKSRDGTALTGWFIPAPPPVYGTVIQFHGNALNMTAHYGLVSWLPKSGFNVFIFDYRGYGASGGRPTQEGVYEDSVAALRYLKTRTDIDQGKIIVFGQSLGAALAISVVRDNHFDGIAGVAEESGFASRTEVARDHVGWLADLMVEDLHSPLAAVPKISPIPLFIIHGTDDRTVPYHNGQELFAAAREPKEMWTIENGGHLAATLGHDPEGAKARLRKKFLEWVGAPAAAAQP